MRVPLTERWATARLAHFSAPPPTHTRQVVSHWLAVCSTYLHPQVSIPALNVHECMLL